MIPAHAKSPDIGSQKYGHAAPHLHPGCPCGCIDRTYLHLPRCDPLHLTGKATAASLAGQRHKLRCPANFFGRGPFHAAPRAPADPTDPSWARNRRGMLQTCTSGDSPYLIFIQRADPPRLPRAARLPFRTQKIDPEHVLGAAHPSKCRSGVKEWPIRVRRTPPPIRTM